VDCKEQLELFHSSVIHTNFNELGHALLYSDLPVTPLLLQLNGHIMSLLRLVLLEGRILLYSRSCAVVSTAVYALAMLLPGCLPLGFSSTSSSTARNGTSPRTAAAAAAAAVHPAFSARAYRWRKYGLPLQTFHSNTSSGSSGGGCRLEPLLVMAEAAAVLACSGFLAGTTNAMISSMPSAALDCFVNLDDGTVRTARTPLAKAAFTPGADDRAFVQSLVAATRASTAHTGDIGTTADAATSSAGAATGSSSSKGLKIHKHSGSVNWEGSGPWAADQIQLFFEEMLVRAAAALAQAEQQADSTSSSSNSGAAVDTKAGTNSSTTTANASSNRRANSGSGWGFDAMLSTAAWLTGAATTTAVTAAANNDSRNSSSSDAIVQAALAEYGRDWAAHWLRTHNYKHWCSVQNVPQEELAARPRHKRVLASIGSNSSGSSTDAVDSPKKQQPCPQSSCHTYSYPTGDVYIGEFVKGRREGRGHYVEHSTGNTYEGEWRRYLRIHVYTYIHLQNDSE
jgi:Transport protein Avl9